MGENGIRARLVFYGGSWIFAAAGAAAAYGDGDAL